MVDEGDNRTEAEADADWHNKNNIIFFQPIENQLV
jgi:hypothetical protein